MKKIILNAFKIIFFLGLGIFFIWLFMHNLTEEEKKEIYESFIHANYFWIFVSIVLALISHISRSMRWIILLEPLGFKPRLKNTFFAVMIGYLANLALPRLGEITRCGILARYEKIPLQKSFGTVVTERAIDLVTMLLAFVIAFFVHFNRLKQFGQTAVVKNAVERYNQLENPGYLYYAGALLIAVIIFVFYKLRHKISHLKLYQKIKEIVFGFIEGFKSLLNIKKPFWFIFHSIFIWVLYLFMSWVVFKSLPETKDLGLGVGLAVLVFGSIAIIVVQGGIGIYPWIVAEILAVWAVPVTAGYAMGWLIWSGQTIMIIVAGILSLILVPIINNKKHVQS